MDRTPEIGSPNFRPTYIRLIMKKLAMRLLVKGDIFGIFQEFLPKILYPDF